MVKSCIFFSSRTIEIWPKLNDQYSYIYYLYKSMLVILAVISWTVQRNESVAKDPKVFRVNAHARATECQGWHNQNASERERKSDGCVFTAHLKHRRIPYVSREIVVVMFMECVQLFFPHARCYFEISSFEQCGMFLFNFQLLNCRHVKSIVLCNAYTKIFWCLCSFICSWCFFFFIFWAVGTHLVFGKDVAIVQRYMV